MIAVLIKRGNLEIDTSTQGERPVNVKAEIGMMLLQIKKYQILRANQQNQGKRHGTYSLLQPSEGTSTADSFILYF